MSSEELLDNARLMASESSTAIYPDASNSVDDAEIAQLCRDCWAPLEQRPNFYEIWAFLQRKRLQVQ